LTFRLLLLAHLLGVIVWVGGMFFVHFALRPSAAEILQPPDRLRLMAAALGRFFSWVEASIVLILASGIGMMMIVGHQGSMFAVPPYVHLMFALGLVMMAVFGHIRFASFKRLGAAVAASDWPAAAGALGRIRTLVTLNLSLGLVTTLVGAAGPGLVALG
jgi:uncharacterized membrane protein